MKLTGDYIQGWLKSYFNNLRHEDFDFSDTLTNLIEEEKRILFESEYFNKIMFPFWKEHIEPDITKEDLEDLVNSEIDEVFLEETIIDYEQIGLDYLSDFEDLYEADISIDNWDDTGNCIEYILCVDINVDHPILNSLSFDAYGYLYLYKQDFSASLVIHLLKNEDISLVYKKDNYNGSWYE